EEGGGGLVGEGGGMEEGGVDDELRRRRARRRLKANAEPSAARSRVAVARRRHGVGEGEERAALAARGAEAGDELGVLVLEHGGEVLAAHLAGSRALEPLPHPPVVCGGGLGDGTPAA